MIVLCTLSLCAAASAYTQSIDRAPWSAFEPLVGASMSHVRDSFVYVPDNNVRSDDNWQTVKLESIGATRDPLRSAAYMRLPLSQADNRCSQLATRYLLVDFSIAIYDTPFSSLLHSARGMVAELVMGDAGSNIANPSGLRYLFGTGVANDGTTGYQFPTMAYGVETFNGADQCDRTVSFTESIFCDRSRVYKFPAEPVVFEQQFDVSARIAIDGSTKRGKFSSVEFRSNALFGGEWRKLATAEYTADMSKWLGGTQSYVWLVSTHAKLRLDRLSITVQDQCVGDTTGAAPATSTAQTSTSQSATAVPVTSESAGTVQATAAPRTTSSRATAAVPDTANAVSSDTARPATKASAITMSSETSPSTGVPSPNTMSSAEPRPTSVFGPNTMSSGQEPAEESDDQIVWVAASIAGGIFGLGLLVLGAVALRVLCLYGKEKESDEEASGTEMQRRATPNEYHSLSLAQEGDYSAPPPPRDSEYEDINETLGDYNSAGKANVAPAHAYDRVGDSAHHYQPAPPERSAYDKVTDALMWDGTGTWTHDVSDVSTDNEVH